MRETQIQFKGLITQPNKYGEYMRGALAVCDGVDMREPGILSAMATYASYKTDVGFSAYDPKRLFSWDDQSRMVGIFNNGSLDYTAIFSQAGNSVVRYATTDSATDDPDYTSGRDNAASMRNRFFMTTDKCPLVMDSTTAFRQAGLPAPQAIYANGPVPGQAIAMGNVARYRAIFEREFSDGYTLSGPVSVAFDMEAPGSALDIGMRVYFSGAGWDIKAGDTIKLYRTKGQTIGTDPGEVLREAVTYTVVAGDVTNGYADVVDDTLDDALGAELYTNPGVLGITKSYEAPGIARDVVDYRGHMLWAVTDGRHEVALRIKGKIGNLSSTPDRVSGIGVRTATGDTNTGSPVIANWSNFNGIVVGQEMAGPGIPSGSLITVVNSGAGTVTIDQNATATATGASLGTYDQIEIDGQVFRIAALTDIALNLATSSANVLVQSDKSLLFTTSAISGASVIFRRPTVHEGSFTYRGTNGANYDPPIPEIGATADTTTRDTNLRRVYYSEAELPEAVPLVNYFLVGRGEIERMVAGQDAVYVFATDGLYRVTGQLDSWDVQPLDPDLRLEHPHAADSLRGEVWAYTNRGLVAIGGGGVRRVSENLVENDIRSFRDGLAPFSGSIQVACNKTTNEVWLHIWGEDEAAAYYQKTWKWHANTQAFTRFGTEVLADAPYIAYANHAIGTDAFILLVNDTTPDAVMFYSSNVNRSPVQAVTLQLQPFSVGDTGVLKQWMEVGWLMNPYTAAPDPQVSATVGMVGDTYALGLDDNAKDHTVVAWPGRDTAIGEYAEPYWATTALQNYFAEWYGLSLRVEMFSEQVAR